MCTVVIYFLQHNVLNATKQALGWLSVQEVENQANINGRPNQALSLYLWW